MGGYGHKGKWGGRKREVIKGGEVGKKKGPEEVEKKADGVGGTSYASAGSRIPVSRSRCSGPETSLRPVMGLP